MLAQRYRVSKPEHLVPTTSCPPTKAQPTSSPRSQEPAKEAREKTTDHTSPTTRVSRCLTTRTLRPLAESLLLAMCISYRSNSTSIARRIWSEWSTLVEVVRLDTLSQLRMSQTLPRRTSCSNPEPEHQSSFVSLLSHLEESSQMKPATREVLLSSSTPGRETTTSWG